MNTDPKLINEDNFQSIINASRILILDDHPGNVEQVEQILELNGFHNFRSITDPRKFKELLEEFDPDLILLDLQMPHLNGFQILEILKNEAKENSFLPVLVLTADINDESREKALRLGAMDFLSKPFNFLEVVLRIKNLLHTRQLHQKTKLYNDILELKVSKRTHELKTAHNKLIDQERYKAMGQMASGIAHDFNNCVAVIMSVAEMHNTIPELNENTKKVSQSFATILTAAKDASCIVSRLRSFYKPQLDEEENRETADLKDAAEEVIEMTQPRWRDQARSEGCFIQIETALTPLTVRMAPAKLREILTNLIFNAIDAMPDGGEIFIRSNQKNELGILEVEDTGIGMDSLTQDKCMEMFYSTKGSNGTGVGLNSVNTLISEHHGSISVESEVGSGTKFTISLPLEKQTKVISEIETDFQINRQLNILAVDDDPNVLSMLQMTLKTNGHVVKTATDGEEAFEVFQKNRFDLVVSDLAMPKSNGLQLLKKIRAIDPTIPTILITGFGDKLKDEGFNAREVTVLLSKPAGGALIKKTIYDIFTKNN